MSNAGSKLDEKSRPGAHDRAGLTKQLLAATSHKGQYRSLSVRDGPSTPMILKSKNWLSPILAASLMRKVSGRPTNSIIVLIARRALYTSMALKTVNSRQ